MYRCEAPQGTQEWLDARIGCLSGSNIYRMMTKPKAKTATISKTAMEYALELATDMYYGSCLEIPKNYAMERGNLLEPVARDLFIEITGLDVFEGGFIKTEEDSLCGCSLDGEVIDGGNLEIKCRLRKGFVDRLLNGIPKKDIYQMQWGMAITGAPHCYYVCYTNEPVDGDRINIEKVMRDDIMIEEMEDKAVEMVEMIKDYYQLIQDKQNELNKNIKEI